MDDGRSEIGGFEDVAVTDRTDDPTLIMVSAEN